VFLLPDNASPGMLEDLCLEAVASDPAAPCLDEYFTCVFQRGNRRPVEVAKARVHAWLASQLKPDLRLGEAAEAGYWPWNSPVFDQLRAFLRAL
jgi:hypothetical protein